MKNDELMQFLDKVKFLKREVKFFSNGKEYEINDVAINDSEILLSDDLPAEFFEEDFRYDD
jgi:hypothetical protein